MKHTCITVIFLTFFSLAILFLCIELYKEIQKGKEITQKLEELYEQKKNDEVIRYTEIKKQEQMQANSVINHLNNHLIASGIPPYTVKIRGRLMDRNDFSHAKHGNICLAEMYDLYGVLYYKDEKRASGEGFLFSLPYSNFKIKITVVKDKLWGWHGYNEEHPSIRFRVVEVEE